MAHEAPEPADGWLARVRRIQAIAATGLHFAEAGFDRARYEEIDGLARELLADLARVPVERLDGLVHEGAQGYATPRIDVRGAVLDRAGARILLVREAVDGRWTLPGGFADVGASAAENVEREIAEEAGIEVRAARLFAVRHKARHPYRPDVRDFYKLFFLCERLDGAEPRAADETTAVGFFAPGALPELSTGRTIAADVAAAFAHHADPGRAVEFD